MSIWELFGWKKSYDEKPKRVKEPEVPWYEKQLRELCEKWTIGERVFHCNRICVVAGFRSYTPFLDDRPDVGVWLHYLDNGGVIHSLFVDYYLAMKMEKAV